MSLAYCFDCLERIDQCICNNPSDEFIYGELRVAYEKGKRDALSSTDRQLNYPNRKLNKRE